VRQWHRLVCPPKPIRCFPGIILNNDAFKKLAQTYDDVIFCESSRLLLIQVECKRLLKLQIDVRVLFNNSKFEESGFRRAVPLLL
jgi:hypothetical protein